MTTFSQMRKEREEFDVLLALAQREHRAGRLAEAAAAYRKMLAIRPDLAEVHNDLGTVLAQQGQLDEAAQRLSQAIALKPAFLEAHNNLGNVLLFQGKLAEAATQYERALALKPDYPEACNNLGNALLRQGKLVEAAARFERAIALNPGYAEAYNNLGDVLHQQGKLDLAVIRFGQALALNPNYAEAYNNLGNALLFQGKLDDAATRYRQALALRPDLAEAHSNLGNVLLNLGRLDDAAEHLRQALALRPDYAEAHGNFGNVLLNQGKIDEAAAHYERALTLRPNYAEAHNSLGVIRWEQRKFADAATSFEQAISIYPAYASAHWGLAACRLVQGDYQRGWPAYEGRLHTRGIEPVHKLPRWKGEPLAGRSLLLFAEQGLGDAFHFLRYARLFKQQGVRVVLAAQASLTPLLASHPDLDEVFILGSAPELPRCDFYLPLLSVPGALHTDAASIPGEVPYLWADPQLTEKWRGELAAIDGFKIGIVWQGARKFASDRWRSIPLAQFAPLAKLPGVRLVSLQKGFGSEQLAAADFPVVDLSGRLDEAAGPFMDTAAIIRNLDLVVTPDTAIGHLAGALGAPVWLALRFSPDWRSRLLDRDDSPWYPSMRLFRQTAFGDWPGVFDRIAKAVQARHSETA